MRTTFVTPFVVLAGRRLTTLTATLVVIVFVGTAVAANAQTVGEIDTVRVGLTVSGGVSLGSYQAGVNWTLIQLFKQTGDDAFARRFSGGTRYELAAVAGASAGSINGFLTAMEWCTLDGSGGAPVPEESTFWRIWVKTGLDQIFREEEYASRAPTDGAVLHREYFETEHLETIRSAMLAVPDSTGRHPRPGCNIPVGLTLTRLSPTLVEISPGISARTQRYVSAVNVRARRQNAVDRLVFTAPDRRVRTAEDLGELMFLQSGSGGLHRPEQIMELAAASSAVPLAFAPVELSFIDPRGGPCMTPSAAGCLRTDYFNDGGAFDSNPLDLALGLMEPVQDDSESDLVLFVNPGQLRGELEELRAPELDAPNRYGLTGLIDFLEGAVTSARQYELHSFERTLKRDPARYGNVRIAATTRGHPVFGEHLGSFGAFLGRPFREHDFFVGMYDGVVSFAELACRSAGDGIPAGGTTDCVPTLVRGLVQANVIPFGDVGSHAIGPLFEHEFGIDAGMVRPPSFGEGATPNQIRTGLLRAVMDAEEAAAAGASTSEVSCSGRRIDQWVCSGGLAEILDVLREHDGYRAAHDRFARFPTCAPANWRTSPDECVAEQTFFRFVDRPAEFLAERLTRVVRRIWRAEREANPDDSGLEKGIEAAEFFILAFLYRSFEEGVFDQSTVPDDTHSWAIFKFLPHYLSFDFFSPGGEVGFHPGINLSATTRLTARASYHVNIDSTYADTHRLITGLGISHPGMVFDRFEESVLFSPGLGDAAEKAVGLSITGYLPGNFLGVEFRRWWPRRTGLDSRWDVSITLHDLNGLMYWIKRIR